MDESKARNLVCEAGKRLLREGLVERTWGNVSIRISSEEMIVTPGGLEYEVLTPADMVKVNIRTLEYSGKLKPSSEKNLHARIYLERKNINAVIHTHQQNASTLAAAQRTLPPVLDDMAQIVGPDVRVARYAPSSSRAIVKNTIKALRGRMAAFMANHGAVCIGRDLEEAFVVARVLEKACKTYIEAEFLGGAKSVGKFDALLMHQYYLRKYSKQKK
ncbi:MAG: class II aldolase/adducin family protein [Bacteroidales bacterium]|nr:class II aldolase/adducin family protein [Bacteroidales bacterium]